MNDLYPYWQYCWQHTDYDELFLDICQRYQEPQRHYHTLQHLRECLAIWQEVRERLHFPRLVALAIFYHDVIYQVKSKTNESDSADYARKQLRQTDLLPDEIDLIADWILATKNHQNNQKFGSREHHDLNYLLDMDLAILAQDTARFCEYEQQIRAEYQWVNFLIYRIKRRQVLRRFYQQEPLYFSDELRAKFEIAAKHNLQQALSGSLKFK